jgi:hypothetical protein
MRERIAKTFKERNRRRERQGYVQKEEEREKEEVKIIKSNRKAGIYREEGGKR